MLARGRTSRPRALRPQTLRADIGVGVKLSRDAGGERIELDGRETGASARLLRHQTEEVADTCRGLQNAPVRKSKPLHGLVDAVNDDRGGIVRVESRSARSFIFFRRKQRVELLALPFPIRRCVPCEDLRNAAPADVFDERALHFVGRRAASGIQLPNQLDRRKVVPTLLFGEPSPSRSSAVMR